MARALAGKPSVVILDRTLDLLGPRESEHLFEALLAERDLSVVLVTDQPALAVRVDDHLDLSELERSRGEAA
jgi:ABC-type phosphate transport system ATPase subunit